MQESQEMQVQPLYWEDPMQKDMATRSVFLPGESHSPERVSKSWTRQKQLSTHVLLWPKTTAVYFFSQFWKLVDVSRSMIPLKAIEESSLASSCFWWFASNLWHSLDCRGITASLHPHMAFSACVFPLCGSDSVSKAPLFVRTPVTLDYYPL